MNVSTGYSKPVVYSVEYAEEGNYSWSGGISDEDAVVCGKCCRCLRGSPNMTG